jgi:hypothetical protein
VCGIADAADAQRLILSGAAFALVDVTITQPPGASQANERPVPVDSASVLVGSLPNGPVMTLLEASSTEDQGFMPAGEYAVLVTNGGSPSTYTIADGINGTFDAKGDQLVQRCPGDELGKVVEATAGLTDKAQLIGLFDEAFKLAPPPPPESQ